MSFDYDFGNGYNWLVREWPYLVGQGALVPWPVSSSSSSTSAAATSSSSSSAVILVPETVVVVRTSQSPLWFDFDGTKYVGRYGVLDVLTYDPTRFQFNLTSKLGNVTTFQDFNQKTAPQGLFKGFNAVGGEAITVTQYAGQNIQQVQRTAGAAGVTEQITYSYAGADLQTVLLQRSIGGVMTNVRQAQYAYYGGGDPNGSPSDLQTATIQTWNGSAWQNQKTYYYRYWTVPSSTSSASSASSSAPSFGSSYLANHLLKFVVNPASYGRMQAAGVNPLTASDTELAQYADMYMEYDANRHVTKEALNGGKYVYTFAYFTPSQISSSSSSSPSSSSSSSTVPPTPYDIWAMKTVETRPDGSTRTVYTNEIGQVLLDQLASGTSKWINVQQFTDAANLALHAFPSAVAGFDETRSDLGISLNPSSGLIETYTWFGAATSSSSSSSLSSSSGMPALMPDGYLQAAFVQQGANGTPIMLRQYQYGSQSAAGATVYPVTALTEFRNDDGTGAVTTSYAYAFYTGTLAVQQRTTIYPVVSAAQNGSGVAATRQEYRDQLGNLTWEMGPRGFIMYQNFDPVTGGLLQHIDDFNTNLPGQPTPPAGWTTPAGGGLNLVTDYQVDSIGRTTQGLGPSHTVDIGGVATTVRTATWTVYQDSTDSGAASEIWTGQGYATGSSPSYAYTLVNPVSITRFNDDGQVTDQISAVRSYTNGPLVSTDTFPQTSYCRWTTNLYDSFSGEISATRVYFLIPVSGSGVEGTNYNQTDFAYDAIGRQNRVVNPGKTITRTVFEARNLPLSIYVGTNDNGATDTDPTGGGAPGNNMVAVTINQYDGGAAGGDGNLTLLTLPVDGNSSNNRSTAMQYDWRNRRVQVTAAQDWYLVNTFDTMNRATQVDRHAQGSGTLIGRAQTLFDDRGHIYQTVMYGVDPSTGVVGNRLAGNIWRDASGNVIMRLPAGSNLFNKSVYDGAGREVARYQGYYLGTINYAEATSVADDTIVEQLEMMLDAANNTIQTTTRQRFHNATGIGPLTQPGGSQPQARVTYVALYPDAIGRQQAVADYGTNGDVPFSRSATIPARSDTVLVTGTAYNDRGEAFQSTDPAGTVNQTTFDEAGRRTIFIDNYQPAASSTSSSSTPSSSSSSSMPTSDDANRTTKWAWTADDQISTLTAVNAETGDQTTTYGYGATLGTSDIARNDVLTSITYADGGVVSMLVNRQNENKQITDQNGTVHVIDRDLLGRQINDRVTALGSGVDGSVQRIGVAYEVRGLVQRVTSYSSPAEGQGNIANDVQRAYNSFSQPITEYQEHSGQVNIATSPKVQYQYADGSTNTIRPTAILYPSGRQLHLSYGGTGAIDDALSRVAALIDSDGVTHLADYTRLGAATVVQVTSSQPQIAWSLVNGTGADPYTGLDAFNRVVDSRWYSTATNTDLDRVQHGYDRASNRLWRKAPVADTAGLSLDELYAYDGLYRLAELQRGQLNSSNNGIVSGTFDFAQAWGLDSTGNWAQYWENDTGASWNLQQTRTSNTANEISAIDGGGWVLPIYDKAGDMTTLPQPANPTAADTAVYDAWHRLVSLSSGASFISTSAYDGLHRRASELVSGTTRHHYYSASWQVLEERLGGSTSPDRQFVWGQRYLDDLVVRDRGSERFYALQDPNWNVAAICDASGSINERYNYAAYGQPTFRNAAFTPISSSAYDWETLFAGYRWDHESALYAVRFRTLMPSLGGWSTRDPQGISDDNLNLYAYVESSPQYLDPYGLAKLWFEFNGFIPASHGVKFRTPAPLKAGPGGRWVQEPFGTPTSILMTFATFKARGPWFYATDNRTFGGGTSRVFYRGWIDSESIGNASTTGGWDAERGTSGSRRVRNEWVADPETGGYTTWVDETMRTNVGGGSMIFESACSSTIQLSASGGDPFLEPFAPNIDFTVDFNFTVGESKNSVEVSVNGIHNQYPSYEALVTTTPSSLAVPIRGQLIYKYAAAAGLYNLIVGLNTSVLFGAGPLTLTAKTKGCR